MGRGARQHQWQAEGRIQGTDGHDGADRSDLRGVRAADSRLALRFEGEIGEEKTTDLVDIITRSPGAKRTYDAYLGMVPEMTDAQKAILWDRMVLAREDALAAWSDGQIVKIFKKYKVRNETSIDYFGYGYQQRYQAWAKSQR